MRWASLAPPGVKRRLVSLQSSILGLEGTAIALHDMVRAPRSGHSVHKAFAFARSFRIREERRDARIERFLALAERLEFGLELPGRVKYFVRPCETRL